MRTPRSAPRLLIAGLALALLLPAAALADTEVIAPDGTLYEVFPTTVSAVDWTASGEPDANFAVLGLRITPPGEPSRLEIVAGTRNASTEGSCSIDLEEATGTLFVAYVKSAGMLSDMHVAVRRDGEWLNEDILPSRGLYFSVNPRVVVTRQDYVDFGPDGLPVTKTRSIFSLVWWEESGPSQARFGAVFIEDGALRLDTVTAWNLNELAGSPGPTDATGLPISSYSFPSVQADPTSNGGVLVTFANLVTRTQQVLRISFPDDLVKLSPPDSTKVPDDVWARAHVPIGRSAGSGRIPENMNTLTEVGAIASQKGTTTFYWVQSGGMYFIKSDDPEGAAPRRLALRPDFSADRALRVVRTFAERN